MVILREIFYEFFTSFKMALILRTWPEYKKDLKRAGTRWRYDKDSKFPFIYVRDPKTSSKEIHTTI